MSELSHKQLSLILHEIATTRVGMTGCHLFTITYSMVAQVHIKLKNILLLIYMHDMIICYLILCICGLHLVGRSFDNIFHHISTISRSRTVKNGV